jgi:hypothetical protein
LTNFTKTVTKTVTTPTKKFQRKTLWKEQPSKEKTFMKKKQSTAKHPLDRFPRKWYTPQRNFSLR